eukprot:12921807-Prorocentrum_lima.AAC.1
MATLQWKLLTLLSGALATHISGVSQGARWCKAQLSSKMIKKIILLDHACSLARHMTQAGNELCLREVAEALRCPAQA